MSLETAMKVLENAPRPELKTDLVQAPQETKDSATESLKQDKEAAAEVKNAEAAQPIENIEEKAPEKTEPKKDETPLSAKFAALAKKEKAIVRQQNELKDREQKREQEYAQKDAEFKAREEKLAAASQLWETDPLGALEKMGYSYQKLTDMILSGKTLIDKKPEDPIEYAKKIEEKLRKEFADKETARETAAAKAQEDAKKNQAAEVERALSMFREEIGEHITAHPDDYELTQLYGQQELIIETVQEFYDKHQRVLSVKEAADMVERYLYDEAQKALKTKKLGKKEEVPKPKDEPKAAAPQSKTLNNNMTPIASSILPAASEADRMKRAMAALDSKR